MFFTSILTADHYGSAELLFVRPSSTISSYRCLGADNPAQGQFRQSLPSPNRVVCATKWCVFRPTNPTRLVVESAVQERLIRTQSKSVDLLQVCAVGESKSGFVLTVAQFHWGDYSDKGYITALRHLQDLQAEGKVTTIGLCNFDAIRTDEICTELGPGSIVSNQVQVCTDPELTCTYP